MRRISGAVIVIALASAVGALGFASSASSNTTTTTPVYVDHAWVPVITCATSTGLNETTPTTVASLRPLTLPSDLMGRVTFYTDAFAWVTPLLGPANWNCSVDEGADGTYGITIESPSGTPGNEFVSASSYGPCAGCVYAVVCPWLSKALRRSYQAGIGCRTLPARERVREVALSRDTSRGTFFITDPPGVSGSLTSTPSSHYESQGYVEYDIQRRQAFSLDCALPASMVDICHLVEAEFLSSKWGE